MSRRCMTSSLAALLLAGARAQSCFTPNMEYVGDRVIAPGYTHTAEHCQFQCSITYACAFFTWRAEANSTLGLLGPGGCLKYNDQATLVPASSNNTISGPVQCPNVNGTAAPVAPTMPPVPTVVPPVLPTPAPVPVTPVNGTFNLNGTTVKCVNITNSSSCAPTVTERGSFPWWAVLLIALVIIGVGAAVIYGTCDSAKKKKKSSKSKKSKKESRSTAAVVESGEAAALVRTEAPPPVVEAPVVPTAAPAVMQQAAPMYIEQQPMQQVVYTSQGQMIVQAPQPQVQYQMPVLSGGARSPAFR